MKNIGICFNQAQNMSADTQKSMNRLLKMEDSMEDLPNFL